MKRLVILSLALAAAALAQTATPLAAAPSADISPVSLPVPKLPAMFGGYVQYNQLGTPQINGGVVAIYPVFQSQGIYGSTVTDILPLKSTDPTTGKPFVGLTTSVRQGFHKDLLDTWKFSFFVGGDIGPTFASNTSPVVSGGAATISVSFSTSVTGTLIYKVNPWLDVMLPVRMLYVAASGSIPGRWNPVASVGFLVNLKKLPPKAK